MKGARKSARYKWIGIWLTIGWLLIVTVYLLSTRQNPFVLPPNEFGDFFAGAIGPIGILWIVLGFWQQGDELRNSVEALRLQSEELANAVEQQRALVEISREQLLENREAINEERITRLQELLPVLTLSTNGGTGSGSRGYSSDMKISNSGPDCTEIKIFDAEDDQQLDMTVPALPKGKSERFSLQYSSEGHMDFKLRIEFRAQDENLYIQTFRLQRSDPRVLGFTITKGPPPYRLNLTAKPIN